MRLNIHLFSEEATSFEDLLDLDDRSLHVQWETAHGLPFRCDVVLASRFRDRPHWASYLEEFFDLQWASSSTSSAALLTNIDNRFFTATFGNGRHLLNSAYLVPDFGLGVTANFLDLLRPLSTKDLILPALNASRSTGCSSCHTATSGSPIRRRCPTIVYAIGTERRGELRGLLPFFSRVNLTNHATVIRAFGYDVRPAKIQIVQSPSPTGVRLARRAAARRGAGVPRGHPNRAASSIPDVRSIHDSADGVRPEFAEGDSRTLDAGGLPVCPAAGTRQDG